MAKMYNTENNISFNVNLLNNNFLDIKPTREDFENWIPFEFSFNVDEEEYNYMPEAGATFTLFEIRRLISSFQDSISKKVNGLEVERYEFCSSEGYFDIIVSDPLEENLISVEIWINIGTLTNGKSFGYNKGFRFEVYLNVFESFTVDIKEQLEQLTSKVFNN